MISTVVTSSTVSIATALSGSLTIIGVVILIVLVMQKQFLSASESENSRRISQAINIALPPMLMIFVVLVSLKVFEILK
jgi:hypothetical protein